MKQVDVSSLFEAERGVTAPADLTERGLARLLPAVAANVMPATLSGQALAFTWSTVSKWVLSGFVVGLVGAGTAASVLEPAGSRVSAPQILPAAPVAAAQKPAAPASASALPVTVTAPAQPAPVVPARGPSAPAPARPSAEPSTFDAELHLITLAKAELDAGRPHLARARLSEHNARYPAGIFTSDREALSVLIRCKERPDPGAAREFAAQHPASPLLARLRRVCAAAETSNFPNEESARGEPTHEEGEK